jgi:thiamine-monophosphate kinase
MSAGEDELVAWLRARMAVPAGRVPVGIGDDAAAVRTDGTLVVITADMLLEGVHFDRAEHGCELIGRKAIACSLSDCAAMACEPRGATVSVALAHDMTLDDAKRLYEGMAGIAEEFHCPLIGGDTTRWKGRLCLDVAMLAEPMDPRGPVLRSTARSGDALYVSGTLGGSIAGRHLHFVPRIELARVLAAERSLHAMMDISDGLALDLHRLCAASERDAELDAGQLDRAVSDAARQCAEADGRSPLDHALTDGEDFELLIAADASLDPDRFNLLPIGRVLPRRQADASSVRIRHPDATCEVLEPRGFDHLKR